MSGHLWANRVVVVVGTLFLAVSIVFAVLWSALPGPAAPARTARATPGVPVASTSRTLYQDSFLHDPVGSTPAGWSVADGFWDGVVEAGGSRVVQHGAEAGSYGHLVAGSAAWTDYVVSARLWLPPLSTGFAGVAARYQGPGDYYACGVYYGTAVRLWMERGGDTILLDARSVDVGSDSFHDVRLVVDGSRQSCVFDQTVVLQAADTSFASGRIALVAGSEEGAEFGDVSVGG
jgi:hypothetical protein